MKTVLVTGGAGFIGSNFIAYISKRYPEYRILVLDVLTYAGAVENIPEDVRKSGRFEFWYGDVNNLDLVSDLVRKSDIVVHFAAETHVARSLYQNRVFFTTDVLGTQSVTNAVLKHRDKLDRFIHVSTSEVYGTALREPMDEEHPLNPKTPYAAAKAGADRLVYSYIQSYDVPGIIVRPFNNYGVRQHLEKLIPRFVTSALLKEPLTVHGDGSASRDWIFVEDTVRGIDMAMHAPIGKVKGQVFNFGTGKALSVLDIAKTILDLFQLDKTYLTFMEERMGQVQKHISSTAKASELLGFRAEVPFDEGLRKTIEWFKGNKSYWERQLFMRKVPIKDKEGNIILF